MEASALRAPAAVATRRPGGGVLLRLRSDEQLVALFRQGNEDAFRLIHDRYRQRLAAYARQMLGGSATDADDAMQDVFLRAYAALRADDRPITLRAWLYRVAHNRCIDHLRRPASQPMAELSEDTRPLPATTGDPILAAERREDLRRLVTDVRALPEQQRSALLMREMEGLTYQELAAALSVTMPAVKSLLVRARMGLVESQQARDTPCLQIREDITAAHDRGVRASGRARRHARECPGCAGYRTTLKAISDGLDALSPSPGPWTFFAKLIGLGAGGSGAAGGAAAAGGGAAGVGAAGAAGAGAAGAGAAAATKFAAVVCCAAVFGGGVEAAREQAARPHKPATAAAHDSVGQPAAGAGAGALRALAGGRPERVVGPSERAAKAKHAGKHGRPAVAQAVTVVHPSTSTGLPPVVIPTGDGGAEAPVEDATVIVAPVPATVPTDPTAPAAPVTGPPGTASTGAPTGAASTGTPGDPTAAATAGPGSASAPVAQAAQTGVSSGAASGGAPAPAERPSPRGS